MKSKKRITLSIIFCLLSVSVQAEHLPLGSDVLAECHGFSAKGKIKRLYKEKQYVVNFYKDSRPIHCTPFAWSNMFLVPYKKVEQYTGKLKSSDGIFGRFKDEVFNVGDTLTINYKTKTKGQLFSTKHTVMVKIKEINSNGAAQFETIGGEEMARRLFQRWVGTNYVTLDFSRTLVADKLTILNVKK